MAAAQGDKLSESRQRSVTTATPTTLNTKTTRNTQIPAFLEVVAKEPFPARTLLHELRA